MGLTNSKSKQIRSKKAGRPRVDKTSVEYLSKNLFHKENLIGFQFTAGRTPRAIRDKESFGLTFGLNFDESKSRFVIDCSELELEYKIMKEFFPGYEKYDRLNISNKSIGHLTIMFNDLGYQTECAETIGQWFWFRVRCNNEEIPKHVDILKEALKDFKL